MSKALTLLASILLLSCGTDTPQSPPPPVETDKSQEIVDRAIEVHGGERFVGSLLEFDFRKKHYSAIRTKDQYVYTRSFQHDSLGHVQDTLINSSDFVRYRDGQKQELTAEWQARYGNSINSVLYFTQLPFGLNDGAVRKKYLNKVELEGEPYHKIQVTFAQEGGGDDFDDIYMYWIHEKNHTLDYLGYEFHVNGGGTRFRKAIDRQTLNGVVFQNYINYKAESKSTPIVQHDQLFEEGKLIELSRIVNENIDLGIGVQDQTSSL